MKHVKLAVLALMTGLTALAINSNTATKTNSNTEVSSTAVVTSKNAIIGSSKPVTRVLIYPNPSSDKIVLQTLGLFTLTLSDMDGKIIKQKKNSNYMDVSTVKGGLYILDYKDNTGINQHQIITIKGK